MQRFLARVTQIGGDLVLIEQVSRPTDPGFGGGIGAGGDPGYGHPGGGWSPTDPGFGRPGGGGRPDNDLPWGPGHPSGGFPIGGGGGGGHPGNALPVPPPAGVVSPPINLPARPELPAGAGIVVPLPEGATVPQPTGGEPAPPAGSKPYILWYGPGTQSSVVHLAPSTPSAEPKAPKEKKA